MSDHDNPTTEAEIDLNELLKKSGIGTRSYPEVIPALIRVFKQQRDELIKLRKEVQRERLWNATREAGC